MTGGGVRLMGMTIHRLMTAIASEPVHLRQAAGSGTDARGNELQTSEAVEATRTDRNAAAD